MDLARPPGAFDLPVVGRWRKSAFRLHIHPAGWHDATLDGGPHARDPVLRKGRVEKDEIEPRVVLGGPARKRRLRMPPWRNYYVPFEAMLTDPQSLAEAAKELMEVDLVKGEPMERLVERLYTTPPEVIVNATAFATGHFTPEVLAEARTLPRKGYLEFDAQPARMSE